MPGVDLVVVKIIDEQGNPISAANPLDVTGGSGGTSHIDDAAFTPESSSFTPVGGIVTSDSVNDGDAGAFAMLANRQQKVTLYDSSGNELSVGGGTQYAVDAALGANPTGTLGLAKRDDALSALTPVEGDAVELRVDANGALWVIPSGTVTVSGTVTANAGTNLNTSALLTTAAHDAAFGTAGSADSQVRSIQGIASMTPVQVGDNSSSLTVDAPVGTPVFVRLSDGSSAITTLPVSLASVPSHAVTNAGTFAVQVDAALPVGASAIGNVGLIGRTSGGMSMFRSIDIDESEEEIKGSAGQMFSISAFNRTAAPLYLKFYNATAANVTVGTTTPVLTFVVPANADSDGAGFIWNNEIGFAFSTAISVACTTGVADNDTGAPGANDCIINVGYV